MSLYFPGTLRTNGEVLAGLLRKERRAYEKIRVWTCNALSREACHPWQCVTPALTEKQPFALGYLPGQYEDALVSPDGRWVAFTAEHVYGPEDLLVILTK